MFAICHLPNLEFFKTALIGKLFLEYVSIGLSTLFYRFFDKNEKQLKVGKVRNFDEETE